MNLNPAARVLVEQHGKGGRWEGQFSIVHEEAEAVVGRAMQELDVLCDDLSNDSIELALPREASGDLLPRFDATLHERGFRRFTPLQPLASDVGSHFLVASYLREPEVLFEVSKDDPRVDAIGAALWESWLPFSWQGEEDRWRLWVPQVWSGLARDVLSASHRLSRDDCRELGLPAGSSRALPVIPTASGRGIRAHRFALLKGASERADLDRFLTQVRRPSWPWMIEVLADPGYSDFMYRQWGSEEVFLRYELDYWDEEDGFDMDYFSYNALHISYDSSIDPVVSAVSPTGGLRHLLFTIGAPEVWAVGSAVNGELCSPVTRRLWTAGIPVGIEIGQVSYAHVPGVYFQEAARAVAESYWPIPERVAVLRTPRVGQQPPEIEAVAEDGSVFSWDAWPGERVLLLFLYEEAPFAGRALRVAGELLAEVEAAGEAHRLVIISYWDGWLDEALELHELEPPTARFVTTTEDQLGEPQGFLLLPAGLTVDGAGLVSGVLVGQDNYYSFVRQLRQALGLPPGQTWAEFGALPEFGGDR